MEWDCVCGGGEERPVPVTFPRIHQQHVGDGASRLNATVAHKVDDMYLYVFRWTSP